MQAEDPTVTPDALHIGYRPIRRVAPPEAPWPGVLTRLPDDESCVLVDAAALGDRWGGWHAEQDGHVLAPVDIVRRLDGHDVAIPVCSERVEAFLARCQGSRDRLDDGECVTLAISMIRGASEVVRGRGGASAGGEWWLTDAGRPVLVTDVDGPSAAQLLESLCATVEGRLGRILAVAAAAASDPRVLLRDLDELESALFEVASPLPLGTRAFAPLSVREAIAPRNAEPEELPWARRVDSLARHVDADLTELLSDTVTRVWRRLRRPRAAGHRRPWLIAACLAGGILGAGMLWPAGGGPATAEGSPAPAAVSSESAAVTPEATEVPPTAPRSGDAITGTADTASIDWETGAAGLLTRRAACAGALGCLADVIEDPSRTFPAGVADGSGQDLVLTLLDEFGGAAVLRVESAAGSSPAQLVVVVRTQDRLLLRDIHDVAEKKA